MKTHNIVSNIVELSKDDNDKEVMAAVSRNPTLKWIKFVLTDDAFNVNKQRIPKNEFANLVNTGVHMPIKMAEGAILEGHEYSVPIGTITALAERETSVEGIAALWSREFPEEVKILEEMAKSDKKPQLSWEIMYQDSVAEETGEALRDVALRAATIVGMPAYEGRTPILTMASKTTTATNPDAVVDTVTNEGEADYKIVTEEVKPMEIKELEDKITLLEGEKLTLATQVKDLQTAMEALTSERDTLAAFKHTVDATNEKAQKLTAITELFTKSGVDLPEDYLTDDAKAEKLLGMDLAQLEFMIQELAVFASKKTVEESASEKHSITGKKTIPNISDKNEDLTPKEIAEKMREEREKSKK
jgi:hypothetical protein